jgi:isopentenyldiphosphate isomerase
MSEQIIIVDEQDKIIAYKDRQRIKPGDIYRITALWLENSKGEVLLAQRGLNKNYYPGKWGAAAAGMVDKGENYEKTMLREMREELSLKNIEIVKGYKQTVAEERNYFMQWFSAKVDKPSNKFNIQKEEVNTMKWFSKEELFEVIEKTPDIFMGSLIVYIKLYYKCDK